MIIIQIIIIQVVIIINLINKICIYIKNNNIIYRQSSLYLLILNYLNLPSSDNIQPLAQFILGVVILSLLSLIAFLDICLYLLIIYIYDKYKIEDKYPILKTNKILKFIIKKYRQTTIFWIIIQIIFILLSLSLIFIFNLLALKNFL